MVDASQYNFILRQVANAQNKVDDFSNVILASANKVDPGMISKSSGLFGIGSSTEIKVTAGTIEQMRNDLMNIPDPAYKGYNMGSNFPSALVAFEKMIGNEVEIASNGQLQLAPITDANIAALGENLDQKYDQFVSIQLQTAKEEPTMQPASSSCSAPIKAAFEKAIATGQYDYSLQDGLLKQAMHVDLEKSGRLDCQALVTQDSVKEMKGRGGSI